MKTYIIRNWKEECECFACGMPLYGGDTVFSRSEDGDPCCSNTCADKLYERAVRKGHKLIQEIFTIK